MNEYTVQKAWIGYWVRAEVKRGVWLTGHVWTWRGAMKAIRQAQRLYEDEREPPPQWHFPRRAS